MVAVGPKNRVHFTGGMDRQPSREMVLDWVFVLDTMRAGNAYLEVSAKRRVIAMTDISPEGHADEDDVQSLIRFMLYTNKVDVDAFIATRIGDATIRTDYIRKIVKAYVQVHSNLSLQNTCYPKPELPETGLGPRWPIS